MADSKTILNHVYLYLLYIFCAFLHSPLFPFVSIIHTHAHTHTHIRTQAETEETVDDYYDAMLRESLGEIAYDMGYSTKVFNNQLFTGEEEVFASERCVSRLMEMRGGMYKMSPHEPGLGFAGLDTGCLEFDQTWYVGAPHGPRHGEVRSTRAAPLGLLHEGRSGFQIFYILTYAQY